MERERRAEQEGIGDIGPPPQRPLRCLTKLSDQQDRFLTTTTKQQNKADTMIVQRPKCGQCVATNQVSVPPPWFLQREGP